MIKYLPYIIKATFKALICMLAVIVFSIWWLIVFNTDDWQKFLDFMWKNNEN